MNLLINEKKHKAIANKISNSVGLRTNSKSGAFPHTTGYIHGKEINKSLYKYDKFERVSRSKRLNKIGKIAFKPKNVFKIPHHN